MTQEKEKLINEITVQWESISDSLHWLDSCEPLPDTPEIIDLMTDLVITLYGPALRELGGL